MCNKKTGKHTIQRLKVGARRSPRLLYGYIVIYIGLYLSYIQVVYYRGFQIPNAVNNFRDLGSATIAFPPFLLHFSLILNILTRLKSATIEIFKDLVCHFGQISAK